MHRPALLALALVAAPPAGAQVADRLDDLRLETAVRIALVADARTRPLDVEVVARDGVVWVDGDPAVADVARSTPGVRALGGAGVGDVPAAPPVTVESRPAPPADGAADQDGGRAAYHDVRRGDTLFSLARRYGTTVDAILALNGRRAPSIRVGERLRVR